MNTKPVTHVVYGQDKMAKPRAAVIPAMDLDTAHRAAASLGLKIGRADTPEALGLTTSLPELKVFMTGKGLVPLVKKELYDRLTKLLAPVAAPSPAPQSSTAKGSASPPADPKAPAPPDLWQAIKAGSITLCKDPEPGPDRSWWECVVQSVTKDGKLLKVRWKNYPGQPAFTVRRDAVAILPPSTTAKS